MSRRIIIGALAIISLWVPMHSQTVIKPATKITRTSFAVITDTPTWNACSNEIQQYAGVLSDEQLPTFIVHHQWKSPEEVKKQIINLHKKYNLEGVVFVGEIPIPMVRKAQHLTSAFKMDETVDRRDSSVPSDRFYDDFHLKFDYIGQDSLNLQFYYYELAVESPQQIKCDIYSARVKPIASGIAPYEQIKHFFNKAVEQHKSENKLDQFFSYTGEGSYSNSLTAWTQEAETVRSQMPGTFDLPTSPGRARFMRYSFSDYPKNDIINMLRRDDLDLSIFHEHGVPERQYLSGIPATEDFSNDVEVLKESLRNQARRASSDSARMASFVAQQAKNGLAPTWWAGYDKPELIEADSLTDLKRGFVLTDIDEIKPNSRLVIFDACYNGDFREPDNIASRYIFSDGKTIVTFANSVNVLQDKQANEMLGLLWLGSRVGQWAQETNILESHIIGDPTFRFTPSAEEVDGAALCSTKYNEAEQLALVANSPYLDVRNVAMHRLWRNGSKELSPVLLNVFNNSSVAMERYTAMSLLEKLNDDNYRQVLKSAINDPNEFIRRTAANRMGRVGLDEYVPYLVNAYYDDNLSARVAFNIEMVLGGFSADAIKEALAGKDDALSANLLKVIPSRAERDSSIIDKNEKESWRLLYINTLRNNNSHASLPSYLSLLEDPQEKEIVKLTMLRALAWYDKSYRRDEIIDACQRIMKSSKESKAMKAEAKRTYYRLK